MNTSPQDSEPPGGVEQGDCGGTRGEGRDGAVHASGGGLLQQDQEEGGAEDQAEGPEAAAGRTTEDGAGRYVQLWQPHI